MQYKKPLMIISITVLFVFTMQRSMALVVEDPVEWADTIANKVVLVKQLANQGIQIKNQIGQLENMKQRLESITGVNAMGHLMNSAKDLSHEQWSPGSWSNALQESGGNNARYQQLEKQYKQNHVSVSSAVYAKGQGSEFTKNYQNQVRTNKAATAMATYAYNQVNKSLKALHELADDISSSANKTLKESMDLNSRIAIQLALIEIQTERMTTLINQQLSASSATRIAAETQTSQEHASEQISKGH